MKRRHCHHHHHHSSRRILSGTIAVLTASLSWSSNVQAAAVALRGGYQESSDSFYVHRLSASAGQQKNQEGSRERMKRMNNERKKKNQEARQKQQQKGGENKSLTKQEKKDQKNKENEEEASLAGDSSASSAMSSMFAGKNSDLSSVLVTDKGDKAKQQLLELAQQFHQQEQQQQQQQDSIDGDQIDNGQNKKDKEKDSDKKDKDKKDKDKKDKEESDGNGEDKLTKQEKKDLAKLTDGELTIRPEPSNINEQGNENESESQNPNDLSQMFQDVGDQGYNIHGDNNHVDEADNGNETKPSMPNSGHDTDHHENSDLNGMESDSNSQNDLSQKFQDILDVGGQTDSNQDSNNHEQEDLTTNGSSASSSPPSKDSFTFLNKLIDTSVQLDGFESPSTLLPWTMSGLEWTMHQFSDGAYEGKSSIKSGITQEVTQVSTTGEVLYSNLTWTTESPFEGGVLSFQVKSLNGLLAMPNEVFVVTIDDVFDELRISSSSDDWVEYSIPVEKGKHQVTWSHIYNPLGLEALPKRKGEIGLLIDDLRLNPLGGSRVQGFEGGDVDNELGMTSDGDAVWRVDDGSSDQRSSYLVARTDEISKSSGSSNINFLLTSINGGVLKYSLSTSTTAPYDDFAIILNGKVSEAIFGQNSDFESRSLDIPKGKVNITFQHRKNPGQLDETFLQGLGVVDTNGITKIDDVLFEPN